MSQTTPIAAIRTALVALLGELVPGPKITTHLRNLDSYGQRQQTAGVYTVLMGERSGYRYEYQPGEWPRVTIYVYAEQLISGSDPGPEIDAAEDAMIAAFERAANEAPKRTALRELILTSCVPSAQTVSPVASVLATFTYGFDR